MLFTDTGLFPSSQPRQHGKTTWLEKTIPHGQGSPARRLSMQDVVSATVYLKELSDFAKMIAVYGIYFKYMPRARATVQVARIPTDGLVAISAIASK